MNKKRLWACFAIVGLCILSGCSEESVYTLSKDEVKIKVHETEFDPLDYLLKDGEPLDEGDRARSEKRCLPFLNTD